MISCIICSRQREISAELNINIASTIGCDYELIIIDNSNNEYSICSAYNEGVRRAKGNILCFMHEDIVYHTTAWGKIVIAYFQKNPKVGMVGVAGTHFLSSVPSGWWETGCKSCHLIQGFEEKGQYQSNLSCVSKYKSVTTQVVAIDGMWCCMQRDIFNFIQWDEITLNGFHGYDIDMSLQVWNLDYEVHIIWDVLVEHKSLGNAGEVFYETYEILWAKWHDFLPIVKGIDLLMSEQEARTEIVELKRIIREKNRYIECVYNSYAYRIGTCILFPLKKIKEWLRI